MRIFFHALYLCAYAAFRAGEAIVRLLPLDAAFVVGRMGGGVAYLTMRGRRAVALRNLRLAFGSEMTEAQLRDLNREHFRLLGANLVAALKSSTMSHSAIWERVEANIPQDRAQTGWIALISHIGNWELFSHLGEKAPEYRFGAVYQRLANPYIDAHLRRTRARSGVTLFDRREEMLKCVKFLRSGGVVGVLVDQGAGYAGLWTPLFGRLTSSSTLAATLSIRTGLPVVPLAIYTSGRARWRLEIGAPVYPSHDDPEALTAQINRLLEEQIRRSPADWLWAHNRWKPLRPHLLFARDQRRVFIPPALAAQRLDGFRILLVSPSTDNEARTTLPAVRAIERGRPDTSLAVLTSAAAAPIWRATPEVQAVIEFSDGEGVRSIVTKIHATGSFDAAVFFAYTWKSALAVWRAGIPVRVGRRGGVKSMFFNQRAAPADPRADAVAAHLQLAQSIGANINQPIL